MKRILYFLIIVVGLSACTDGFDELNKDPNRPITASMPSIMLSAQRTITHTLLDDNNIWVAMTWVQYHGRLGYTEQVFDYDWNIDAIYNNETYVLNNLEKLRKQAIEKKHLNYEAIAMIMEAWIFANWTDMNGDIPYSEALRGEEERLLYPKYDSQESIYKNLVLKLKEAAGKIDLNPGVADVDGESDIYGQGDMLKWKKFANSLRARLYLRMSEVDNATAKAGLEEIFGDEDTYPVMEGNEDNVGVKFYSDASPNRVTFVQQTRENNNIRTVGSTVVDLLCENNDPRRTIFLNPTENSVDSVAEGIWTEYEYTGAPAAVPNPMASFDRKKVSTVGDAIALDWYRPIDVMTYSEVMFIKAEAASKGYSVGESAEAAYEAGIEASMKKWGVIDEGAISNYMAGAFATFDVSKAKEQILTQRYLDQFHQALNTFAMLRRGGFPHLDFVSIGFSIENGYPDRLPYSHNQRGGNPNFSSVEPQLTNNLWGNVWWASETEVVTSPAYVAPVKYKFSE